MPEPLHIMLDISVVGIGQYHSRGRTGIYRAIEGLLYGLLGRDDTCLSYTATRSPGITAKTRLALRQLPGLSDGDLIMPPSRFGTAVVNSFCRAFEHNGSTAARVAEYADRVLRYLPYRGTYPAAGQLAGQGIFHATFYALPAVTAPQVQRFLTIYDLIPLRHPAYTRWNERLALQQALRSLRPEDQVITISQASKDDVCSLAGIAPERVSVTHLAASDQFYPCCDKIRQARIRNRYGIPPEGPYILSVGTLEPRKNIPRLIESFARLVRQEAVHGLTLVLVGGKGWDGDHTFTRLLAAHDLCERVILTGYVQDEDLAPLYSGALMFVYPSLYEGFGLPPLEAMQCGVPVITSNSSSLPEVVGDAGIMVDPADGEALCQAMLAIYTSPVYAAKLAARSHARARLFSWERCADETVQAYRRALK